MSVGRGVWVGGALVAGVLFGASPLGASTVGGLIIFANGTLADAGEVNANFAAVKAAVDDNDARITAVEAGGVGVGGSTAPRWVSFNGESGVVVHASSGVRSVVRNQSGEYVIYWEQPFPSEDYVVTGTCNMLGTSGAKFGLEGNNERGHLYEGMTATQVSVGCRDSTNNSRDSDLVHVMAVQHDGGFVVFDGDGSVPIVRASANVDSVARTSSGNWEIRWSTPFADRNYLVTGACNLWGSGGAKFGFEGHNVPGRSSEAFYADRLEVGCRDSTNAAVDTDLVMLTALPSDGGANPPAGWVSFNGTSGVVVNGSNNVDSVVRVNAGRYTINWSANFADANYIVTGTCNMAGTSGTKFGLEGNNITGDSDEYLFEDRVDVGCRDSTNAGRDSDLVTVIAYNAQ